MKQSISILLVASLTLFLAACSKSSKSSEPVVPTVPASLEFTKPIPGEKLTREQVQEVKKMFSNRPMMQLPPGELIFQSELTDAEKKAMEADLFKNDPMSYKMLKEIQPNCTVQNPIPQINTSLPQKPDGSYDGSNPKKGDFISMTITAGLTSANDACPLNAGLSFGGGIKVEELNASNGQATLSGEIGFKGQGQVLKSEYAQLLKAHGLVIDTNLSGLTAIKQNLADLIVKFRLAGSYHSLESVIPYDSSVEFLTRGASTSEDDNAALTGTVEVVMKTLIRFPKFVINVEIHAAGKNGSEEMTTQEIYVNGHPMTQKEFEDLFGDQNPAGGLDKKIQGLVNMI